MKDRDPARAFGGPDGLLAVEPSWRTVPPRWVSDEARLRLRADIFSRIDAYYDRDHLTRAGDWMLVICPEAEDHLIVAALLHDLERSVPGGPVLDMARDPWDDPGYNTAHTSRSAQVVHDWLLERQAPGQLADAVMEPIRQHEFGGSPDGDLMQAADSISYLETNAALTAGWALGGRCTVDKARQKLMWMGDRVRHPQGREIAIAYQRRALKQFEMLIQEARR